MIEMPLSPKTRRGGAKRPRFGRRPRRAALSAVLLVSTSALGIGQAEAGEDLLRVTCRGLFQLSVTEPALECSESDMLTDPQGGLMSAFSAAEAALSDPRVGVGAAGGGIRDVGYIGREATALMLQSVRIIGEWQGRMPLTVTLEIRYGFGGYGEGRMKAALRSSLDGTIRRENLSGFRMRHTGLGGAMLTDDASSGDYTAAPARTLPLPFHPVAQRRAGGPQRAAGGADPGRPAGARHSQPREPGRQHFGPGEGPGPDPALRTLPGRRPLAKRRDRGLADAVERR